MKINLYEIGSFDLAVALIPTVVVIVILAVWSLNSKTAIYASVRMLIQLIAIGYILTSIFSINNSSIVLLVLAVMLLVGKLDCTKTIKATFFTFIS